jgi:phosphatidylserine/phosphatidylglycerophosphate/cardiolipin synthase-like enzyme
VGVATSELAAVAQSLESGALTAPVTAVALARAPRSAGASLAAALDGLPLDAALRVLEVALAERAAHVPPKLDLVWTGDDPSASQARHGRVLLPELFRSAREHVLVAGYSFDRPEELFAPLAERMRDHGVTVQLFVDIGQLEERLRQTARRERRSWSALAMPLSRASTAEARGRAVVDLFFQLMWPANERPRVFFDPRTAERRPTISLHAKCVVVDHQRTLITSANFTERGQRRNLEAGVAIEDRAFALALERQWANLVEAGVVVAC